MHSNDIKVCIIKNFISEKFRFISDSVFHEITKEFCKNSQFENMTVVFLLSKLTLANEA